MKYTERLFPDLSQSMGSGRTSSEGTRKRSLPFKAPSRVDSGSQSASTMTKPGSVSTVGSKAANKKIGLAKGSVSKSKSNGFKPASKAAVALSSDDAEQDEESDELDIPPAKKQKRRRITNEDDDEDQEDEEADDVEEERHIVQNHTSKRKPKEGNDLSALPQKLLTRLLYEGFEDKNVKIGTEAMSVVGKYMDTFVREALARAVYEREEADAELGKGTGDGFLQVEDLEKLAPQLLLDF